MKKCLSKLLALGLSLAMCLPAIPAQAIMAAEGDGITFNEPESVGTAELGNERSTLFNEDWKFYLGEAKSAEEASYNDSTWESVTLPHDYSISQEFTTKCDDESGYLPGGTGWYRKKFTLPASCQNKSILINFDGVYKNSTVYVNGELLGEHRYGYSPFAYDIGDYVTCDGATENVIAVKVEHQTPSSRWYSGSGIYRDVNLIITDPIHVDLDGTEVTTPNLAGSNGTDGTVKVKVKIVNDTKYQTAVTVSNKIYNADGTLAATSSGSTVTVEGGNTADALDTAVVSNPKLWTTWSAGEQNLYRVHTELSVNGSVVDEYDSTLGFRWFEFDNEVGFKMNGQNIKLNGMCLHHDQGALGSAAYYDAVYRQLSIMKEMGVNAIRIVHNPGCKQYLEICNELGLIAIEELFDGWDRSKNSNTYDFAGDFLQKLSDDNQIYGGSSDMTWAEFALKSTIRRGRNNPSLILWSLGNEISEGGGESNKFPEIARNLTQWIKDEDSTRKATIGQNKVDTMNADGIFSANLQGALDAVVESGGVLGFNYGNINNINKLADKYGCIIASETASHTNSRGIYNSQANNTANVANKYHITSYDMSAVSWGRKANETIWCVINKDNVAGQFVWTGFDYIGEPTPKNDTVPGGNTALDGSGNNAPIPNSSYFGVVETTGFEKDSFYLYRSQWKQDDTTLHLVTAWDSDNMMTTSDGKTPVWIYSNAPVVKLYRNGTHIGTATRTENTTPAAGHKFYTYTVQSTNSGICAAQNGSGSTSLYSVFNVVYEAGTISAKAFEADGTTEITETTGKASVSTPGAASKLNASVDKTEITADGKSLAYITIDVTDANDILDTTANNEITVSLSGAGEIAGVDNGDQSSLKKFQQPTALLSPTSASIDAYAGKALVIVRSQKTGGKITLNLSASGLTGKTVEIDSVSEGEGDKEIISYRMVKHFYAPAGTESITLPDDVEATYADSSTKSFKISWNAYGKADFAKAGSVRIDGSFTADGKKVDVFITGHIYNRIAMAENFSIMTKPNVMPTLPRTTMTYYADGTAFEAFPVSWNLDGITADTFDEANKIVVINGTVTALGATYPVTASVRVAYPVIDKHENVATEASRLTADRQYSDTLTSVKDGVKTDNGAATSRWSTYNQRDAGSATLSMAWDTPTTANRIDLYYFYQKNAEASALPTSVKFEYTQTCTWNAAENTIEDADWKEITYDPEKIQMFAVDGAYDDWTTEYSYQLDSTIAFQAFRVTLGWENGKYIGLNEIEVMKPTESYYANTEAELDGITIGNKKINFSSDKTEYVIDAASFDRLTVLNTLNAAITKVKVSDDEMKLIVVSEDGRTSKTYTLKLEPKPTDCPPPPAEPVSKATVGDVEYQILTDTTAIAIGTTNTKAKSITIEASVTIGDKSYDVTEIAANAFKAAKGTLKTVTIGKNVTSIGKNAFNGCKKITKITFKGTALKPCKKNAFKGTKKKVKVIAPKSIKTAKRKTFVTNLTKTGGMKSPKVQYKK